jgi:hypothetical protein
MHSVFMRYLFWSHRAIFRQHTFKEFTALCTLSIVFLKYVVTIIINFGVIGCLFFLSFVLRPSVPHWMCRSLGRVSCVDLCSLYIYIFNDILNILMYTSVN